MERILDSNILIDLIKLHPQLYIKGSSSSNPATMRARDLAWKIVSQEMNVSVKIIRSRWKSLRDTFQKCLKKARESQNDSVTIGWPYFEKLLFLKDHVGCKKNYPYPYGTPKESLYEGNDNDPISYDENSSLNKDDTTLENSGIETKIEKFETEICAQFIEDEERVSEEDRSIDKTSYYDEKSNKVLLMRPAVKRKLDNYTDGSPSKRTNLEENYVLDNKITQCLDIFKDKLEKKKDSLDNFSEFLSSIIKQWPVKEQCETIKYLTEYVMEQHTTIIQNKKV